LRWSWSTPTSKAKIDAVTPDPWANIPIWDRVESTLARERNINITCDIIAIPCTTGHTSSHVTHLWLCEKASVKTQNPIVQKEEEKTPVTNNGLTGANHQKKKMWSFFKYQYTWNTSLPAIGQQTLRCHSVDSTFGYKTNTVVHKTVFPGAKIFFEGWIRNTSWCPPHRLGPHLSMNLSVYPLRINLWSRIYLSDTAQSPVTITNPNFSKLYILALDIFTVQRLIRLWIWKQRDHVNVSCFTREWVAQLKIIWYLNCHLMDRRENPPRLHCIHSESFYTPGPA
jgi:hypothetical protein